MTCFVPTFFAAASVDRLVCQHAGAFIVIYVSDVIDVISNW